MEGKHIANHPHQHQQQQRAGVEIHHTKDPRDVWTCPRCRWTYPNSHPSAKHRRNHRKHCGKIEGFKVISLVDRETQGGSSDDELSDDEHKSTDHEKLSFHKDDNFILQTNSSAPTSDNNSRSPDMSSSKAGVGEAAQRVGASGNAILDSSQTIVPDAMADNSSLSGESGKEISEEATATTEGLGVHGLNVSRAIEPSKNSTGPDMLGFKPESNSFLKEVLDTDISQDASGSVEHQEFPVKGHQNVLDYAELKIQNIQTDNRVLPMPGDSILPVIEPHPSSADVIDSLGLQTMNETIKDHPEISKEQQHISEDVKIPSAKLQKPGHIEPPQTFGKSATTPTRAAVHQNMGISSRKVGIASILSFKETSFDDLNVNFSSVEKILASADKKIYELSPTNPKFSDRKTQEVSISETKDQEVQRAVACPSDCLEGVCANKSSGADRHTENPQFLTLEPQTEKLPQLSSSPISIDSTSARNLHLQVTDGVLYSQEKNGTVAQGISEKQEDYTKSKHTSRINGDYESYREGEQPPNFDKSNSDDMLSPETDSKVVTVIGSSLPKQEAVKETEVPYSKDIEKTSGQEIDSQASIKVVIPGQAISTADGRPTEYFKPGEKHIAENSAFMDSNIIEHDMNGFDSGCKKEDSIEQHITLSDVGMAKHSDNTNSDDMLSPETDNKKVSVIGSGLPKQKAVKETEVPCSKDIEKTSGQEIDFEASCKVIIVDQDMSSADGRPTEYLKPGEKQEAENSTFMDLNVIERDMNGFDPGCKKEDSTEQHITLSDVGMAKHSDADVVAVEKLPKTPASEVLVDEKSAASVSHQPDCVDYSHEDMSTIEQDIFVKPGDYIESTNISPSICGDPDSYGDEEKPQNFNYTTSDGMLCHDEVKEKVVGDTLSKQEAVEESKKTCSKAFETTSGQKLDAQASSVVIPDPEISCTDIPSTENSKAGERQVAECSAFTNSSIIEHEMKDYSSDCTKENSIQGIVTLPDVDINSAPKVIALEVLPETIINEVVDKNSAVSDSHQPECVVYTDENKITVEEAISVKPGDYIEFKQISPINGDSDGHRDDKPPNSNVTNVDDLHPETDKNMIIGTDLSKHKSLDEAKEPCSESIETTLDQQLELPTSVELVIPDQGMSLTDGPSKEDSKFGETEQAECISFTNSSIIQQDFRDCYPDRKSKDSIQGNTALPDVDMDKDIDVNITPLENFPKAPPNEVVDQNSAALESVQPKARDSHSSFQGDAYGDLEAEIPREESDHARLKKGLGHSVMEQNDQLQVGGVFIDTSCSATVTTVDSSSHLNGSMDNHENSSKESMNDIHGSKSELMKTWEQLLETNVNESENLETCQDLGHTRTSPGNPFIPESKLSSSEEVPQTFRIEERHGLISEQLNSMSAEIESTLPPISNGVEQNSIISSGNKVEDDVEAIHLKKNASETSLIVPATVFEAPAFMTLVESGNRSVQQLSHNEIQPKVKERSDGELSADADAEMGSGRHERLHIPLRNLLAKEYMRGTQDQSKPDPLLVEEPQTSSQNNIYGVHASAVGVIDRDGVSSKKLTFLQHDSNSASQKLAEKVWNSPARLPSPKVEKQKVSKVKSAWTMCLCGSDVK